MSGNTKFVYIDNKKTYIIENKKNNKFMSRLLSKMVLLLYIRSDTIWEYILHSIKNC